MYVDNFNRPFRVGGAHTVDALTQQLIGIDPEKRSSRLANSIF